MILSVAWRISDDAEEQRAILLKGLSDPAGEVRITAIQDANAFLSRRSPAYIATELLMLDRLWELTTDPLPEVSIASLRALFYHAQGIRAAKIFYLVDLLCNQSLVALTQHSPRRHIIDLLRLTCLLDSSDVLSPIGNKLVSLVEQMAIETGEAANECEAISRDLQTIGMPISVRAQKALSGQLSSLLQHPEARVRYLTAAIWAAVFKNLPEAPAILPLIQDTDAEVRSAAYDALSETDLIKPGVLAVLLHALRQDKARVKSAILGRIKNSARSRTQIGPSSPPAVLSQPEVVDGLLYALNDVEASIASQAASLLILVQEPLMRKRIIAEAGVRATANLSALHVLWSLVMPTTEEN
jgi:HEAT repeat protein